MLVLCYGVLIVHVFIFIYLFTVIRVGCGIECVSVCCLVLVCGV